MKSGSMLVDIKRWQKINQSPISIETKDPEITSHRKVFLPMQRKYFGWRKEKYFTKREMEIAELIINKQSTYKAIAAALGISPRTVEFYIQSMRNKLQARNKVALCEKLIYLRAEGEL